MADKKLNSLTFPNLPDRYILDAGHVKYSDSDTYAGGTVGKALQEKSAGIENLVTASSVQTLENKVPYLFRQTPNAGHNELDTIVGGTVAWNQLLENGNFASASGWGTDYATTSFADNTLTMSPSVADRANFGVRGMNLLGTGQAVGHKYLVAVDVKVSVACEIQTLVYNTGKYATIPANTWTKKVDILNLTSTTTNYTSRLTAYKADKFSTSDVVQAKNYQVFDLTQMFGSTIADYIYSLETATAGAGVAYFKSLGFDKTYYEYNAGELMSVSGLQSHDMTGFNQWDTSTDNINSALTNDGQLGANDSFCVSDYIKVFPNTEYYFYHVAPSASTNTIAFYDANKTFISVMSVAGSAGSPTSGAKTTPSNARYMRVARYKDTTDACINISSAKNGTYEPYVKHSYSLDSTLTLRGMPKLDASNNVYYDGDVYAPDGTVTRKFGIRTYQSGDESLADAITDGTNTIYKLTTPTTETAQSYQYAQVCDPNGTEEYVTTGIVPVGHDTKYPITLSDIMPTASGNYVLKCTVTGGVATYEWVSES